MKKERIVYRPMNTLSRRKLLSAPASTNDGFEMAGKEQRGGRLLESVPELFQNGWVRVFNTTV